MRSATADRNMAVIVGSCGHRSAEVTWLKSAATAGARGGADPVRCAHRIERLGGDWRQELTEKHGFIDLWRGVRDWFENAHRPIAALVSCTAN